MTGIRRNTRSRSIGRSISSVAPPRMTTPVLGDQLSPKSIGIRMPSGGSTAFRKLSPSPALIDELHAEQVEARAAGRRRSASNVPPAIIRIVPIAK